jgi:protocatechuate 4,5-dioxygenase beta chain
MARITAGVGCSHVPAIGVAMDTHITDQPYWQPVFKGFEKSREWMKENTPDVIFLVYNDHCTAFDASCIPTFALGCAAEFQPADEGWGPRPVPVVKNHQKLASHIAQSLILDEFDITIMNEMEVDHGLTVPLSVMFGETGPDEEWPCAGHPARRQRGAVSGADRQSLLQSRQGGAQGDRELRRGPERHDLRHRRHEPPVAVQARRPDQPGMGQELPRPADVRPGGASQMPHVEYLREAGSEGIEMVMWHVMRGALNDEVKEVHRHYHVPASNTAVGHIILENV